MRSCERGLTELQRKAAEYGLPYQTCVAGILRKFANRRLADTAK
jgi:predicted DNA binding CopG/RHH family protein